MRIIRQAEQYPRDYKKMRLTDEELARVEQLTKELLRREQAGEIGPIDAANPQSVTDTLQTAIDLFSPISDPGFAEEEYDDHPDPDHLRDYREAAADEAYPYKAWGHSGVGNLGPDEYLVNRDPEIGTTVHTEVGGDPPEAVVVYPRDEAGPDDAFLMPDSESGLGYGAIVRRSPSGKGYDVIKAFG